MHLGHPLKTRAIAEAKVKTDKVDAKILAQLLYADLLPEAYLAPTELRQKRYFLRYRLCLNRYRTSLKNRVHSLLHQLGIRTPELTDLFGRSGRAYLKSLKLPEQYLEAMNGYLRLLDKVEEEIKNIQSTLRSQIKEDPKAKLLATAPGIGELLSQVLICEIGPIDRFASAEKLCSYAGMVPSVHQSGNTLFHGSCPRGNKFMRWAMVEAAHVAVRKDPALKAFYERIQRKKGSQKALFASARKLLVSVYHILKKDEPYKFRGNFSR